jgi:hypothetical protein
MRRSTALDISLLFVQHRWLHHRRPSWPGSLCSTLDFKPGFLGYRYASPNPRQAALLLAGGGYEATAAVSRIARLFSDNHTDVYVLSHGRPGETVPSVSLVFSMSAMLAEAAAGTPGVSSSAVTDVGHSLGGWDALPLAGTTQIGCALERPEHLHDSGDFQSPASGAVRWTRRSRSPAMTWKVPRARAATPPARSPPAPKLRARAITFRSASWRATCQVYRAYQRATNSAKPWT